MVPTVGRNHLVKSAFLLLAFVFVVSMMLIPTVAASASATPGFESNHETIPDSSSERTAQIYQHRRNVETSRCIDDSFAYGLRAFPCNGLTFQGWHKGPIGGGSLLKNQATGRCLDDSFTFGLRAIPCNSSPYQTWYIESEFGALFSEHNVQTQRCTDDSFAYGLRAFPCNHTTFQTWRTD